MGLLSTRAPFNPAATFIVRKPGPFGGVDMADGAIITLDDLSHIPERRYRQMYDARFFDIATPREIALYEAQSDLARFDDDGGVMIATRATVATSAVRLEKIPAGTLAVEVINVTATENLPLVEAVGVSHFGFAKWFRVDKDGSKLGEEMTKAQAEALNLPIVPRGKAAK